MSHQLENFQEPHTVIGNIMYVRIQGFTLNDESLKHIQNANKQV